MRAMAGGYDFTGMAPRPEPYSSVTYPQVATSFLFENLKRNFVHSKNITVSTKAMTDIRMFEYLPKLFTISNIWT